MTLDRAEVFVDLSTCTRLGVAGGLLLFAELERCQLLRPGSVSGCDPVEAAARRTLQMLGFYRLFHMDEPAPPPPPWAFAIRSGYDPSGSVVKELEEVAALAMTAWGDQAYADRVLAGLSEAMVNVMMHAYPPAMRGLHAQLRGRWWAGGYAIPGMNSAVFFALDHGIGIPKSAPKNYPEMLREDEIASFPPGKIPDNMILAAAINDRNTSTGLSQHGQGLRSMARLTSELSCSGSLVILSGRAMYFFTNPAAETSGQEFDTWSAELALDFGGTLILWHLDGPAKMGGDSDKDS